MEELQARHRKEQKELQGLITSKKKSASKKTRKGVNDECDKLAQELKERQEKEIAELNGGAPPQNGDDAGSEESEGSADANIQEANGIANGVAKLSVKEDEAQEEQPSRGKKPNRQKARMARRAAEQAEAAAKAQEEADDMPDLHAQEQETMNAALKKRGLVMKEIRADGHCLYSAMADQLHIAEVGLRPSIRPTIIEGEEDFRTVRRTAAEFMKQNKNDFEPFLEEPFDGYVRKVGETGEWGGQLELMALAKAYGVRISVLDGNGGMHEVGDGGEKRLWLGYYRHGFGLGEHYNSLRKG